MDHAAFLNRLQGCYDELKWLYCERYHNDTDTVAYGHL